MDDGRTWRFDGGLVGWNYQPMARSEGRLVPRDLANPETRRIWLCELIGRLPALLCDFATLTEARAYARGDDGGACVIDWRTQDGPSTLLTFLQRGTCTGVEAKLELTCLDKDLEPLEITNGASFKINIRLTDSGTLDPMTDAPVYLRLLLNADIYAPWSLGEIQNNTLLAALNGPRLAGCLERIERDLPAKLLEIDQDHHPRGSVGPRGFIAPAGVLKEA